VGPGPLFFVWILLGVSAQGGVMIATQSVEERVAPLAARIAAREGCELVHCEYVNHAGGWILRLCIDRLDGVTIDDCSAVSRQLSTLLDVEDIIPHAYRLEVSSPGLDRPLHSAADYQRYAGERIKIKTTAAVRGRRRFIGTLEKLEEGVVTVTDEGGQRFEIPLDRVRSARLDPQF
jgi:ribosome maturation factor RimP